MENFISFCTYIPLKICISLVFSVLLTWAYYHFSQKWNTVSNIVSIIIPLTLFWYAITTLVCNVPFWDDYDAILRYLSRPLVERINILTSFHNEHRILIPRICFEVIHFIFGTFNFSACIILGDIILVSYILILGSKITRTTQWEFFIPFIWLFLDLANYENTLWALTAIQSHAVLLLSLLACICFNKSEDHNGYFYLSLIFAAAATYTSGSGMGIWPALVVCAIKRFWLSQHFKVSALLTIKNITLILTMFCLMGVYLNGFAENSTRLALETPPPQTTFMAGCINRIDFFFSFLGAFVPFHFIALPLGIPVFALIVFILINVKRITNNTIFTFWLYLLSIIFSGTLFRGNTGGGAAVALRYGIVSFSILACSVALAAPIINCNQKFLPAWNALGKFLLFGCILINLSVLLLGYNLVGIRKQNLTKGISEWRHSSEGLQYPDKTRAWSILKTAIDTHVYLP